jgi:hypothetical protein
MIMLHKTTRWIYPASLFVLILAQAQAQDAKMVPGFFTAAVYRPADGKLYAGNYDNPLPGEPNSKSFLATVDPLFGVIEQRIPVSSPIAWIQLTDDQSYLYFATYDSVFRFNFALDGIDLRFAPQIGSPGSNYLRDIAIVPGKPDLLIASWNLNFGSDQYALILYENGVRKPDIAQAFNNYQSVTVADDGTQIYTYNRGTTASEISRLVITPTGIAPLPEKYSYVREFSESIQYFDGRIYGSEGTVVQTESNNQLYLAARLDTRLNETRPKSRILRDAPGSDTIYMLSGYGSSAYLQKFDQDNFQLLSTQKLGSLFDLTPAKLVVPLGSPAAAALISDQNTMGIFRSCTSQITNIENFPKAIDYGCYGDTMKLTAPGNFPDDHYYWSDGSRGKTYTRYLADVTTFRLSYQVADGNGCLSPPSDLLEVKTFIKPLAPDIGFIGDNKICAGGFVELTATGQGTQGLQGYDVFWSDGQTGSRIRVEVPGAYYAQSRSPEGCLSPIQQWPTNLFASATPQPPQPTILIEAGDGDEIICSTEPGKLTGPAGYDIYIWSDGLNALENTRALPATGTISLQLQNLEGCRSEASVPLYIQRFNTPAKPGIVRAENVLGSTAPAGNQWFLDGVAIPGASGQFFTATQAGNYTVQVTLNSGCPSPMSDPFAF